MCIDIQGSGKRKSYAITVTQQTGTETPELLHQETVHSLKALRQVQHHWDCFTGDAADVIGFLMQVVPTQSAAKKLSKERVAPNR